ncbi:hypothetical protein [Propionivibrio sp.]|uniref:hypothetical protein n=1 Tax=Propionivibrio sp. TaxID=2212460 RepID=UPI003BF43D1B
MNMNEMLRGAMKIRDPETAVTLDAAKDQETSGASDYTMADLTMAAAANIQQWAETDDLDEGESFADRLMGQMIGVADADQNGEITEDEQGVLDVVLNAAWDYLLKLGVSEEDCSALLNDWDVDTAERVRDLVSSALPEGEEESSADIDDFVFGDNDQEPALDAVYKMRFAVRGGHKTRIKKRISGTVHRSSKQKLAIKKAGLKSHTAGAKMRRMKSMRVSRRMGL